MRVGTRCITLRISLPQEGDGLPDMIGPEAVIAALKSAGFEILETRDVARDPNPEGISWYQPLTPSWNIFTQRFQFNWLGMRVTKAVLWVMELVSFFFPYFTTHVRGGAGSVCHVTELTLLTFFFVL